MQKLTAMAQARPSHSPSQTHAMHPRSNPTYIRPQPLPVAVPHAPLRSTQTTHRGDELAKLFNTVMVTSQSRGKRDFSTELCELTDSAPFKAILSAVRQLSSIHNLTERQAVEQVISTFRKMDQVWGEYVFREGLEKIKSSK